MDFFVINFFDLGVCFVLVVVVFLFVVVIIGKVVVGWVIFSKEKINNLVVGLGMMFCGEVGLIFLGLGIVLGFFSFGFEVVILLMVIGIMFLVLVLLCIVFKDKFFEDGN